MSMLLSLAQDTPEVPNDGCHYVLFRGEVAGRFRALKAATVLYQELKSSLQLKPAAVPKMSVAELPREGDRDRLKQVPVDRRRLQTGSTE